MSKEKKPQEKTRLHLRNKNRKPYDLGALKIAQPELSKYIKLNKHGAESIDFAQPDAVKFLNKALLKHYYGIKHWDFPNENLCPPIPGRADYIHHMADLLARSNFGELPKGEKIKALDIGVGANCIYPIIGVTEYDWSFIGSDINPESVESAKNIGESNKTLTDKVEIKLQENPNSFFKNIISDSDSIDLTFCNPPFHSSTEEATKGTKRKVKNLSGKQEETPELNFAGISNELICEGGEATFINKMIEESKKFKKNVYWFSTLVSKESNLKRIHKQLSEAEATMIKTIPLGTGNKSSRAVAWSFLDKKAQQAWKEKNWKS